MSLFDLLFILLFLASVLTLIVAAVYAIGGRGGAALAIVRRWAVCFAIYMGIVVAVALTAPKREIALGTDRCNDDWCIAVEKHQKMPSGDRTVYAVTFRVSSHALRVMQREKGVSVYLMDDRGRRFDPVPAPSEIPFDVQLAPGQAVETVRSFEVPNDARGVGAVMAHEGSYCFPGCFIIGEDANPLHKRTVFLLP